MTFLSTQRERRRALYAAKRLRGSRFFLDLPWEVRKPPLCPDCGEPMRHLLYNQALDSGFYGCWMCEPPWEGE